MQRAFARHTRSDQRACSSTGIQKLPSRYPWAYHSWLPILGNLTDPAPERSSGLSVRILMSDAGADTRMTVLVVEDQILVRIFAADFLEEAGFKVFEAANADEALTVLEARPDIQAMITDVEMPGSMDGFELARVTHARWPGVRVIVTSGRIEPGSEDLPESIPFLAKPYLPATVINLIRQMATPQIIKASVPNEARP